MPKVATILDYGFTEDPELPGIKTTLVDVFTKNKSSNNSSFRKARFNKENVFIYIQNEGFEVIAEVKRYVITLCISVPRLKSIGYSTIFRKLVPPLTGESAAYVPNRTNSANDTDKSLGPWTFDIQHHNYPAPPPPEPYSYAVWEQTQNNPTRYTARGSEYTISGRNECAVKFTCMGIPSNLWLRLSVLNTDGTTALINSSGWA